MIAAWALIPFPRMALPVGFLKVGDGELGVVPDGVEGLVAEELFDLVHACAGAEHLRGAAALVVTVLQA